MYFLIWACAGSVKVTDSGGNVGDSPIESTAGTDSPADSPTESRVDTAGWPSAGADCSTYTTCLSSLAWAMNA